MYILFFMQAVFLEALHPTLPHAEIHYISFAITMLYGHLYDKKMPK